MQKEESPESSLYTISFEGIEHAYGVTAKELEARGALDKKGVDLLETGEVKALRISTVNAICKETGCHPGELFALLEPSASEENSR